MNVAPLLDAAPQIPVHAFAAMAAFALGVIQLAAPKGTLPHRTLGWIWVGLMLSVALSSFWIHQIRLVGPWSPIHLLSIFTLITVPLGVWEAHRHRLSERTGTKRGSLSFYLARKAPSDRQNWKPNINAVRTTVKYAMSIGRLDRGGTDTSKSNHPAVNFHPPPKTNHTKHPCDPAGFASTAVDRTLNTWRNCLQAHLPLTNPQDPIEDEGYLVCIRAPPTFNICKSLEHTARTCLDCQ